MKIDRLRSSWLSSLRSNNDGDNDGANNTAYRQDGDVFESTCLSPIVQLQGSLLIDYLCAVAESNHKAFTVYKPDEKIRLIKSILEENVRERYVVIGMVVALFTRDEMQHYRSDVQAVNRRILRLLIQAMKDERYLLGLHG